MKWMDPGFLIATLPLCASAADLAGTWKAVFLGPQEKLPKTVTEITFDFKIDGTKLTGIAQAGSWPGRASISDGKIDGEHISFTVLGTLPWKSSWQGGAASGYPRLMFTGALGEKEMTLTLLWDNDMVYGDPKPPVEYRMQARKISD